MIIDGNKFIQFELIEQKGKTQTWVVVNKTSRAILADIKWYGGWHQHVFRPAELTEYNDTCLDVISGFLKRLNKEKIIKEV